MEAVIVSKTKMNHGVCVGAILYDGTGIRLLDVNGNNQPFNTEYNIGQIWDLTYRKRANNTPPHNEDVLVSKSKFIKNDINLLTTLRKIINISPWIGEPDNLFDRLIHWTGSGSGYICQRTGIPEQSVGFYISDDDINALDDKHYGFANPNPFAPVKKIAYVGMQPMITVIPRGTLIRVSLARWWKPENVEIEERCYVQLSGWYLNQSRIVMKSAKRIVVEKNGVYGLYEFKEADKIDTMEMGDTIDWLDIGDKNVRYKATGEYMKKGDEFVFWAERI